MSDVANNLWAQAHYLEGKSLRNVMLARAAAKAADRELFLRVARQFAAQAAYLRTLAAK